MEAAIVLGIPARVKEARTFVGACRYSGFPLTKVKSLIATTKRYWPV